MYGNIFEGCYALRIHNNALVRIEFLYTRRPVMGSAER
jgi:hypothetical protein